MAKRKYKNCNWCAYKCSRFKWIYCPIVDMEVATCRNCGFCLTGCCEGCSRTEKVRQSLTPESAIDG